MSLVAYSANIFIINFVYKKGENPPTDTMSSFIFESCPLFPYISNVTVQYFAVLNQRTVFIANINLHRPI